MRAATAADAAACNALCVRVHGHDRAGELGPRSSEGKARVVEHLGRITGYTTGIGYFSHSVAETNDDLKALIGAAARFDRPGSWSRSATRSCSGGASPTASGCSS